MATWSKFERQLNRCEVSGFARGFIAASDIVMNDDGLSQDTKEKLARVMDEILGGVVNSNASEIKHMLIEGLSNIWDPGVLDGNLHQLVQVVAPLCNELPVNIQFTGAESRDDLIVKLLIVLTALTAVQIDAG